MSNGAVNDISPEALAAVAVSPQFMQAFQAALRQEQQQQQQQPNAGATPGLAQAFQTHQAVQNPFLQMFQGAAPQNPFQQFFPQQLQGGMNLMQMHPFFNFMAQASQAHQLQRQPLLSAVDPAVRVDARPVVRIEPSDAYDAELASRVRDSRLNHASLKLAVERMAETHGHTVTAWKDYFVERADAIFGLADSDAENRENSVLARDPAPASAPQPSSSAPPKTSARQAAAQNLKRKWLPEGESDLSDPEDSPDEDKGDGDYGATSRPAARASTSTPGRSNKRAARASAGGGAAATEPGTQFAAATSSALRKPWTVHDLTMIAEVILEIGEESWTTMNQQSKGVLVNSKHPERTAMAWEQGWKVRKKEIMERVQILKVVRSVEGGGGGAASTPTGVE